MFSEFTGGKRHVRASPRQLEALVMYMEEHSYKVSTKFQSLNCNATALLNWEKLTTFLNSLSSTGRDKDVQSWRNTWRDYKAKVHKKIRMSRKSTRNNREHIVCTKIDQRVWKIIRHEYVQSNKKNKPAKKLTAEKGESSHNNSTVTSETLDLSATENSDEDEDDPDDPPPCEVQSSTSVTFENLSENEDDLNDPPTCQIESSISTTLEETEKKTPYNLRVNVPSSSLLVLTLLDLSTTNNPCENNDNLDVPSTSEAQPSTSTTLQPYISSNLHSADTENPCENEDNPDDPPTCEIQPSTSTTLQTYTPYISSNLHSEIPSIPIVISETSDLSTTNNPCKNDDGLDVPSTCQTQPTSTNLQTIHTPYISSNLHSDIPSTLISIPTVIPETPDLPITNNLCENDNGLDVSSICQTQPTIFQAIDTPYVSSNLHSDVPYTLVPVSAVMSETSDLSTANNLSENDNNLDVSSTSATLQTAYTPYISSNLYSDISSTSLPASTIMSETPELSTINNPYENGDGLDTSSTSATSQNTNGPYMSSNLHSDIPSTSLSAPTVMSETSDLSTINNLSESNNGLDVSSTSATLQNAYISYIPSNLHSDIASTSLPAPTIMQETPEISTINNPCENDDGLNTSSTSTTLQNTNRPYISSNLHSDILSNSQTDHQVYFPLYKPNYDYIYFLPIYNDIYPFYVVPYYKPA